MSNRAKELQQQFINQQEYTASRPKKEKLYWYVRTQAQINRVFYPGFKVPYRYEMPPIPDLTFLKAYVKK